MVSWQGALGVRAYTIARRNGLLSGLFVAIAFISAVPGGGNRIRIIGPAEEGGRFERNTGIYGRVAPRELRRFPTISHGVLSLQGAVKRWIGGQFFEPIRAPDTIGATSCMKHSIDWRSWSKLRLPWKLI
jgi:hypothetical protein